MLLFELFNEAFVDYRSPRHISNDNPPPPNMHEIMATMGEFLQRGEKLSTALDLVSDEFKIDPELLRRMYFGKMKMHEAARNLKKSSSKK
jgi:hypothetical protein